jgi:hypothetical protein
VVSGPRETGQQACIPRPLSTCTSGRRGKRVGSTRRPRRCHCLTEARGALLLELARVLAERDVHLVDLRLVLLEQLRPLELEGGREAIVVDGEALEELVDVALCSHTDGDTRTVAHGT